MDKVKTVFHSAEDALLGSQRTQSGEEPISGVKGKGTATDPYDAGNASNPRIPTNGDENDIPYTMPDNQASPAAATERGEGSDVNNTEKTKPRIISTPNIPEGSTSVRQMDEQNRLAPSTQNQSPHSGSSGTQRSGVEDARERIGSPALHKYAVNDAPETQTPNIAPRNTSSIATERTPSDHPPQNDLHYVKSTGFASEGGDFDATKPGAGREAERLREQHGEELSDRRRSSKARSEDIHYERGGLWTGGHKSGISIAKAKEKLHIGKHRA